METTLKAQVKNGRIVLDEPTDLPEGKVVHLVVMEDEEDDGLDEKQREALHRSLDRGLSQLRAGEGIPAEVILQKIRNRRT
jgi:hypothetical protein